MIKEAKNWIVDKWKKFKRFIVIGILGIGVVAAAPLLPIGDNIINSDTATSTPSIPHTINLDPKSDLPLNQIEAEYIVVDKHYNKEGVLYSELIYPENPKLKKSQLSVYEENIRIIQLENTDLPEVEVLTLYVRGKKTGTATLVIGGVGVITLNMEVKGCLTKWNSSVGKWTQKQINNAYVEFSEGLKISSVYVYLEDQHSLEDNFDSYTDGDLNGQGGWSGSSAYDVQGITVQAGAKAVVVVGGVFGIEKHSQKKQMADRFGG